MMDESSPLLYGESTHCTRRTKLAPKGTEYASRTEHGDARIEPVWHRMRGKVGHLCGCLCGKPLVAVLLEFLFWQRYFVRSIALTGLKQRRAIAEAGAC